MNNYLIRCEICHELIRCDGVHWTHDHGGYECGTGDGSTAYPPPSRSK